MDLAQLDAEVFGPMVVRSGGQLVTVPSATSMGWKQVAAAGSDVRYFVTTVWPAEAPLKWWQMEVVQRVWCVHNGLPTPDQVQRLVFMMQKYGTGIEYDLAHHLPGISARELWQARRWRELLNYIDQFPSDTHKNRMMMNDEEYLAAVVKAGREGDNRPSLAEWNQTNRILADLVDAVRAGNLIAKAAAGSKDKSGMENYPRPATKMAQMEYRAQEAAHKSMVAELLPNRSEEDGYPSSDTPAEQE